jgi:hypothetical protein
MIYGQPQYYNDELKSWIRSIEFHRIQLHESLRHINLLLEHPVVPLPISKECGAFIDQLIVQEQQFDYLVNQIGGQLQRLERTPFFDETPMDISISRQQDALRSKMKTSERNFTNTKYNCSVHLSSSLTHDVPAFQG